jgi:hypothetical protein
MMASEEPRNMWSFVTEWNFGYFVHLVGCVYEVCSPHNAVNIEAHITPRNVTSLQSRCSIESQIPVVTYSRGLTEHGTTYTLWTSGHLSFKRIPTHYSLNFVLWPDFDAFRPTAHSTTSYQQGAHPVQHIQAQIWTDAGVKFYSIMYRGFILSYNYHLSLPTATPLHVWAVSWMGYMHMINKLTENGNQQLSRKIMTPYDTYSLLNNKTSDSTYLAT